MEQKVISKRGGGRTWLFAVNGALFMSGIVVSASGLILQCHYHLLKSPAESIVWGFNCQEWSALHIWTSICFLAVALWHMWAHRTWYEHLWKKNISAKQKPTFVLSLLLVIVSLSGFIPLFIYYFDGGQVIRFTLVEVHDKIALVFFLVAFAHTVKRWRWFLNQIRNKL